MYFQFNFYFSSLFQILLLDFSHFYPWQIISRWFLINEIFIIITQILFYRKTIEKNLLTHIINNSSQQGEQPTAYSIALFLAQYLTANPQQLSVYHRLGVTELTSQSVTAFTNGPKRLALLRTIVTAFGHLILFQFPKSMCKSTLFSITAKAIFRIVFTHFCFVLYFRNLVTLFTLFFNWFLFVCCFHTQLSLWWFWVEFELFLTLD